MPFAELLDVVETWAPAYRPLMSGAVLADAFDAAMVARGSARRAWRGDLERSDLRPVGITLSGGRAWVHQLRDGTAAVRWGSGQVCRWADLPELLHAVASVQLRAAQAAQATAKKRPAASWRERWEEEREAKDEERLAENLKELARRMGAPL